MLVTIIVAESASSPKRIGGRRRQFKVLPGTGWRKFSRHCFSLFICGPCTPCAFYISTTRQMRHDTSDFPRLHAFTGSNYIRLSTRFTSISVNCVTDCAKADDHRGGSITCFFRASTGLSVTPEAFHLLAFDTPRGSRLLIKPRSDTVRQHMASHMQMWTDFALSLSVGRNATVYQS
jgi:hypothetical protein